jgi:DNA-directed RNA polymerase specialized sigma24 family protein
VKPLRGDTESGPYETEARDTFSDFFSHAEPRLRRGLVAAYGSEIGREAAAEALAWAWANWSAVRTMKNPIGYLYRVGQSRRERRRSPVSFASDGAPDALFEPELRPALASLSERQRLAVVLIHGFGWTHREVAELTGTSITTIQNHAERGLTRLRRTLGADQCLD